MKRSPIPPTVVFPAIAVGLLVLAFLYYYFPERIRREDALNRQAFRRLGSVAEMIQGVVSSYGRVLERWANAQGPDTANPDTDKMRGFADQVPDLRYVKVEPRPGVPPAPPGPCPLLLNARSEFGQVLLRFQCGGHSADIPLETLVQRYIQGDPTETFDELLVTDGTGAVLYQTRRTGLHLRSLSGLLTMGAGDKNDKIPPKTVGRRAAGQRHGEDLPGRRRVPAVHLSGAHPPARRRRHSRAGPDHCGPGERIQCPQTGARHTRVRADHGRPDRRPGDLHRLAAAQIPHHARQRTGPARRRTLLLRQQHRHGRAAYRFWRIHLWYRDSDFDDTQRQAGTPGRRHRQQRDAWKPGRRWTPWPRP